MVAMISIMLFVPTKTSRRVFDFVAPISCSRVFMIQIKWKQQNEIYIQTVLLVILRSQLLKVKRLFACVWSSLCMSYVFFNFTCDCTFGKCMFSATKQCLPFENERRSKNRSHGRCLGDWADWPINHLKWQVVSKTRPRISAVIDVTLTKFRTGRPPNSHLCFSWLKCGFSDG